MAVRIFKRIAKEPLPPVVIAGVSVPTHKEISKMSAEEAYKAGEKLGDAINKVMVAAAKANALGTLSPAQVAAARINLKAATTASLTDSVTTLFKKSDTGIGYKQWSIYVRDGNTVVIEWGHCDKSKQEKVYPFVNRPHLMEAWMREAILGKMKKGYSRTK